LVRFNAFGGQLTHTAIAASPGTERNASVAMDSSANAVVAWEEINAGRSFDIKAMRGSNAGGLGTGDDIRSTTAAEASAAVAMNRTGGAFVVAYHTLNGGAQTVEVDEVSANNTKVHFTLGGSNLFPALSMGASGNYFLTRTANPSGDADI